MSVLVYETDLGHYLNQNAKLDNITFKKGESMITIEIDGVSALKGSNALLVQEVADKSWPIVKKEAAGLITTLKKSVDTISDEKKRKVALDKEIDKFNDEVAALLITTASKVFSSFAKDKKDYKIYKLKAGFKIVVNGAGLVASIALTALAGWSGAGTVVGVIGMVRTTASIAQQCVNLSKDSVDIAKRVLTNVVKLKKQLASPNLKTNTLKQTMGTVLNKVFAVEIETLVVTVDAVENDIKLLGNKVKGNKVNAVKMAGDVPKMLDKQDDINAKIKDLLELGVRTKKQQSELKKLQEAQDKSEKALDKLLTNIVTLSETVAYLEKWVVTVEKDIANLKSKYNPNVVKVAGVATDFLLAAGSFVGGNFSDPAQTVQDLHNASKVVVTSLALTNDSLSTVKDLGTTIYDNFKG